MRNASGHQCEVKMSSNEKKVNEKNVSIRSFWKFQVVVVQNNGEEMYKTSVLHKQTCFFAH